MGSADKKLLRGEDKKNLREKKRRDQVKTLLL